MCALGPGDAAEACDRREPSPTPQAPPRGAPATRRAPGRPVLMSREAMLERIRELAQRRAGLFQVHKRHGAFYARARRMFGSWGAAVAAAGMEYVEIMAAARRRSWRARRQRPRRLPRPRKRPE